MAINICDYKNFIFDFDGTIADTYRLHEKAFHLILDKMNVPFNYGDYTGLTTDKVFNDLSTLHNLNLSVTEVSSLVAEKRKTTNKLFQTSIKFIPGADALIQLLVAKQKVLFVASSGSSLNVNAGLQTLDVHKYFTEIATADTVKVSKPEPDIFNYIVRKYQLVLEETVVIEDAVSGIIAANKAGLDVICINEEIENSALNNYSYEVINYSTLHHTLNNE